MRINLLLLLLILSVISSFGQNTIGIPGIINYSKQVYRAGSQNYSIAQDKDGIMYFGNTNGLLSFDGTFWRTYELPNKTIVRSIAVAGDGKIYIGGQEEFGYFYPNKKGELAYTSLKPLLPDNTRDFADIWNTCVFRDRIFFRSNRKIFELYKNKITVHNSVNWGFLGATPTQLIAYDYTKGLVYYKNGQWLPGIKSGSLPKGVPVRSAVAVGTDSILLATLEKGLFILHRDSISPFISDGIRAASSKNINSAYLLSADRIALITNLGGCIIIDKKGLFVQHFGKQEGVQNNNVISILLDRDKNLWLGLANGIDLITYSNSVKNIFPDPDDKNAGSASLIHDHQLYLGDATGVYKIKPDPLNDDLSFINGSFEMVKNIKGQIWNLSEVNGELMVGHINGAYIIHNNEATSLDTTTGFWGFQPLPGRIPSPVAIAGTYNGINFYDYNNGAFINHNIHAHFESARFVVIDNNNIWIAHPYKGLYKVNYNGGKPTSVPYADKKHILSGNHNRLYRAGNKTLLTNDNGIFEYDNKQQDFVHSAYFEKLFSGRQINYINEDRYGNIWFCEGGRLGVADRSATEPKIFMIQELNDKMSSGGVERVNVIDSNNVLITAEKGFFHLNYARYKKRKLPLQAQIRNVISTTTKDGLIFGGYAVPGNPVAGPSINYSGNSLHFEFASNLYGQEQNTEYSYYLDGFDKNWSDWLRKTEKDYTNLPAGNYQFKVKGRINIDNESHVASYSFTILSPWYRTWWAYCLYALLFAGVLYLFYKRQQRKYKRLQQMKLQEQKRKYMEEQKQLQYLHQLEIGENEKKIIQLENEKLQAEIEHKNSELASSAMNMVQKMETLSKLKEDLNNYKSNASGDKGAKEFQKIIKTIDNEFDLSQEWERFAQHFDSVHTNFLKKLKEHCPDITATELKLSAYLRLNLSTKEIAQLMNISIRGVETSRYRLRKKLDLSGDVGLYDFLTNVTR